MVSLQEDVETQVRGAQKTSVKVMVAFGPQTYTLLEAEAKERGVSIQELLRAVIIPEWFRIQGETVARNPGLGGSSRAGDIRETLASSDHHRVLS